MRPLGLTVETLEAVLQQGDEKACVALFAQATEAERQAVAETASRWLKELSANAFIETPTGNVFAESLTQCRRGSRIGFVFFQSTEETRLACRAVRRNCL